MKTDMPEASIIIPAKNAAQTLPQTLESITKFSIQKQAEIIVVIDGIDNPTTSVASRYPVKVIIGNGKGPAAARNIGIAHSRGEILIFLDADCIVSSNWYTEHIKAHQIHHGLFAVGGSICMRQTTSLWATCDHLCSWYNVNPYRKRGCVPNHPPANLSIRRESFNLVGPFQEDLSQKGVHEEAQWQGKLLRMNGRILFEPCASVWHIDRGNFIGYLKHNYWWGYNSLTVKSKTGISRFPFIYKKQTLLLLLFVPFAIAHTFYTILCWLRSGKILALFFGPLIFIGRMSYSIGMVNGKLRNFNDKLKEKEN
jgi:glycosyltransferase involved in cell wall biosynthesis